MTQVFCVQDCIKDLGVFLDSKLYFHQHVYCLFSHSMKLLFTEYEILLSPFL
jgi:hypothetical protein